MSFRSLGNVEENCKASLIEKLVLQSSLKRHCVEDNKFRVVSRVKNLNVEIKKCKMAKCHCIHH